jgi:ribosome modulation factor
MTRKQDTANRNAFENGQSDRSEGKKKNSNPYRPLTSNRESWDRGWKSEAGGHMDLIELALELGLLHIGQKTIIPYEEYATLFPAVDPEQVSPADSYHFAKANNCHIENRPSQQEVWVIKDR